MNKMILTSLVLAMPLASFAADGFDVKPGLWETVTSISMDMAGMPAMPAMPQLTPEQLAKIPAAQRAQIEAAMKGRSGGGSPQTTTVKICQTKESLAKAQYGQQNNNCTSKVTSLTSSKQEIHMECSGQFKGSGDMIVERVDSEHAKGNMVMKTEGEHAMTMKMSFTTKFLSADCGNVKPLGQK